MTPLTVQGALPLRAPRSPLQGRDRGAIGCTALSSGGLLTLIHERTRSHLSRTLALYRSTPESSSSAAIMIAQISLATIESEMKKAKPKDWSAFKYAPFTTHEMERERAILCRRSSSLGRAQQAHGECVRGSER